MKKIVFGIAAAALAISSNVSAVDGPKVLTLEATQSGSTVSYAGTIEVESTAVTCKLWNSSNEELKSFSSAVDDGAFSGSFTSSAEGELSVSCANYSGGDVKKVVATVSSTDPSQDEEQGESTTTPESPATSENANSPKTEDNIMAYVGIFAICAVGIVSAILVSRKSKA